MNKKTTTDWLNDFNDENIESYDTYINKLLTENKFVSELKEESGKVDSKVPVRDRDGEGLLATVGVLSDRAVHQLLGVPA